MKTWRYFGAVLSVCMSAACVSEPRLDNHDGDVYELVAKIAPDGPETRTILMDNPGVRVETRWAATDAITIFGHSGDKHTLSLAAEDIVDNGKTAIFRSSSELPSGSISALYPADANASVSGGKINTVFPESQHYSSYKNLPQPDQAVSLMAGTGSITGGVAFCNVMAVLKIGQAFDENTVITAVTFRDLSGKAVAGTISIDPSDNYSSQVSGGSAILRLDCGEGVELEKDVTGVFYMVVPAREYPKGVEVTFITKDGEQMSRQAGTSNGMTLGRGVVYPMGDISSRDYVAGKDASILADNAHLMTPEILRQIHIIRVNEESVRTPEGGYVTYNYTTIRAPYFTMLVPNSLNIHLGDYLVYEATDDLPTGGIFLVTRVETPYGDDNHSLIEIHMTTEFAKAFKKLDYGEKLFDDEGNVIEGAGTELDLTSYLSEIRDAEGNTVPFSVSEQGQIMIAGDDMEESLTRLLQMASNSLSTPKLSITVTDPSKVCEATLGASLIIKVMAAIKILNQELQFIHVMFNPQVKFSANFSIKGPISKSDSRHLITLYFVPGIAIAPGVVLTPELEIRAGVGVGGEIVFSTSIDYTYDLGKYGFSYTNEQGFLFHHVKNEPAPVSIQPELGASLTGTVYAQGTITAIPTLSLFRVFRVGIYTDYSLKFGLTVGKETIDGNIYDIKKLFLTPEIAFSPYVATLGGTFTSKWENLIPKIEFNPLWERYLNPVMDYNSGFTLNAPGVNQDNFRYHDEGGYYYIACQEGSAFPSLGLWGHGIFHHIDGFNYSCKSLKPTLDDWDVVMLVKGGDYDGRWQDLLLRMCGAVPSYQYTYTNLYEQNRYHLMSIPHNQGENADISASGDIYCPGEFNPKEVRSLHLVCINKSNGRVYPVKEFGPFAYYWPDSPEGPWFSIEKITEYQYYHDDWYSRGHIWPSDIPLP